MSAPPMNQVIGELKSLRARGRIMLSVQRAAVIIAWALAAIVLAVFFDFALRLPSALRLALLVGGIGALIWALWQYLRPAISFQPTLTQLALRVEHVLPSVAGRLASSVEFASGGIDQSNPLAERAVRETQRRLQGESVNAVVRPGRTRRDVAIMLAVLAGVSALIVFNPTVAATGLARLMAPYGSTKWPARTGVESLMGQVVIADGVYPRGEAMALRAAVTRGPDDQRVDAHYRLKAEGDWQPWQHIVLTHQAGLGGATGGAARIHERLIDTDAEAVEVYFTTDDDQTDAEEYELAPPPAVRRASLTVRPPPYAISHVNAYETELGQGIDDRAITDTTSLFGSEATLVLELNKPLPVPSSDGNQRVQWLRTTFGWDDESLLPHFVADSSSPSTWTLRWTLDGTRTLPLSLRDEHALTNAEPIQYRIEAVEDRVPSVTITQPQADEAVLPTAVIALKTEGRDDVALSSLGLEARVQGAGTTQEDALDAPAVWSHADGAGSPEAETTTEMELAPLRLKKGDVVLVNGVAQDVYEMEGARHEPARSPLRRLRVMDETEFATQLRRQLSAVRQSAIRIEAQQSELQDDVIDQGVQPGMSRAQGQIGERIASQREAVEDVERLLRQNRLDDAQLAEILRQTQDLLDFAGRSANKAVEGMERSGNAETQAGRNEDHRKDDNPLAPGSAGGREPPQPGQRKEASGKSREQIPSGNQQPGQAGQQPPRGGDQQSKQDAQRDQQPSPKPKPSEDEAQRAAAPEDQPIVDAQQEVRDELADLIKLLDRDEDTWVVKNQLNKLAQEQAELERQTRNLGQQTVGLKPEDLTDRQRSDADRIAEKQRDLTQQARELIEDMRERGKQMEDVDPQAAESMQQAADTAEQQQLDRDMQQASQQIQQNQMTSAGASQQNAQRTMKKMLNEMEQTKRAQAQQLLRQLASLLESIQRLITVQEGELSSLAVAQDAQNFSGLDRNMIRLNQNTQSVAGEARAAGQESRRIARSLDRAADAQGAAVAALRAAPINAAAAQEAETRSLELLKEAKQLAETLEKQTQEQEVQRRREELIEQYRKFAEREVTIRGQTLDLAKVEQPDRRELVEARRLGTQQEEIRMGLAALRDTTSEILDAPVFSHVHRLIDGWSSQVSDALAGGKTAVDVTDRQQVIADAIGRLMAAIEETMAPPPEFAQDQQNQGQQGGSQGGEQPLIPPYAQLKLLQGLQEQVYNLTKDVDGRADLDEAQRRERLRDLGQQQREMGELAQQMIDALQKNRPPQPSPESDDDQPPDHPPGPPDQPEDPMPEPSPQESQP